MINTEIFFFASIGIAAGIDAIVPVPLLIFDLLDPQRFDECFASGTSLLFESYGLIMLPQSRIVACRDAGV